MAEINHRTSLGLANPTAQVSLTAVNGSAATAMRSDAAPALSQAIVPTWTGIHTFSAMDVHNAGISLGTSGQIQTALPAAASGQYAFDFVDTIDRSATATQSLDLAYRLRNSATSRIYHAVSSRGEHVFGLSGQIQSNIILSFIQDTFNRVGTGTLSTGIFGQILHNSTNSMLYHTGILGAWVHLGGDAASYTQPHASGTVGTAYGGNDVSGFSSVILSGVRGQIATFASILGLQGNTRDNPTFPPGDWEMVTPCYLQGLYRVIGRRGSNPTNQSETYCGIRVPLMDIGNTTGGDSAGVYIENTEVASSGWSGADRCFAIRMPFPNDVVFDNQAHMFFVGSHVGTGGYAAPAGGPPFDELGGAYYDSGANNLPGMYQRNTVWEKLDACSYGQTTLAAAVTTFAVTDRVMEITGDAGANVIATITGASPGYQLTLIFVDALVTITDDNTHGADSIDLSGAFVSADDTVLKLAYDGTSWYEISRSVN